MRVVSTCAKVLTKVGAAHFFVLYGAGGGLEMDPRAGDGEAFLAKVEAVVSPVLEAHGLELVDLVLHVLEVIGARNAREHHAVAEHAG